MKTAGKIIHAVRCGYTTAKERRELHRTYDRILGKLVKMQNNPEPWLLLRANRPN